MVAVNHDLWVEYFTPRTRRVESGCLEWTLRKNTSGYPAIGVTWSPSRVAHRVSYELRFGAIPPGFDIHHMCRNRMCVEPNHLAPMEHVEHCRDNGHNLKTHCPQGHPYDETNTVRKGTRRACKTCAYAESASARSLGKRKAKPGACVDCGVPTSSVRRLRCKPHAARTKVRAEDGRFVGLQVARAASA